MAYTFVESSAFERARPVYLDDDEYAALQWFLLRAPQSGRVVPESGGVRKLRWGVGDSGKRGGLRVVYHVHAKANEVWMLAVYAKAANDNIPGHILKRLLEAFRSA